MICFALQAVLGGNLAVFQFVNCLMTAVELALIPRFIQLGEAVLRSPDAFDASTLISGLQTDLLGTLSGAGTPLMRAAVGWLAFAPFGLLILTYGLRPLLVRVLPKNKRRASLAGLFGSVQQAGRRMSNSVQGLPPPPPMKDPWPASKQD